MRMRLKRQSVSWCPLPSPALHDCFCLRMLKRRCVLHFMQVSGLISLSLAFCDRMEDEGVEALSTLTTLTELDLTYCRAVTDRGVAALHMLTRLQTLKLQGCGARAPHMGGGLSVLRGMGHLQALTLAGATVTQVCCCCVHWEQLLL